MSAGVTAPAFSRMLPGRAGAGAGLLMGFCGMMIGLAFDLRSVMPESLATLCAGTRSLPENLALHASLLPATNVLMLAGCLIGARLASAFEEPDLPAPPFAARLLCAGAMVSGMAMGEWLGPSVAAGFNLRWDLSAMVGAMTLGMGFGTLAGMAAWRAVRRLAALRPCARPQAGKGETIWPTRRAN